MKTSEMFFITFYKVTTLSFIKKTGLNMEFKIETINSYHAIGIFHSYSYSYTAKTDAMKKVLVKRSVSVY